MTSGISTSAEPLLEELLRAFEGLLLDTCTFLWIVSGSDRLSAPARDESPPQRENA